MRNLDDPEALTTAEKKSIARNTRKHLKRANRHFLRADREMKAFHEALERYREKMSRLRPDVWGTPEVDLFPSLSIRVAKLHSNLSPTDLPEETNGEKS